MQDKQEYEYFYNIIILGDMGVGKTPFYHRFLTGNLKEGRYPTNGMNGGSRVIVNRNKERIKTRIWDASGEERFRPLIRNYVKKVSGVILMYDVTKEASFDNLIKWLKIVKETNENSAKIMLIGNKIDIADADPSQKDHVARERAIKFAEENSLLFGETSVNLGINVNEMVEKLIQEIHQREIS